MPMPPMLGYSIYGTLNPGQIPYLRISQGRQSTALGPANPASGSYWIAILDANNPVNKVKEFVVPGTSNTAVPAGSTPT